MPQGGGCPGIKSRKIRVSSRLCKHKCSSGDQNCPPPPSTYHFCSVLDF
jgi:hypothetical protein